MKVIIYHKSLINYSETFIKNQALALERWQPVLVGEKYIKSKGLSLQGLENNLLNPKFTSFLNIIYRIYRYYNYANPFIVRRLSTIGASLIHAHFGPSGVDIWPYAKVLGIPLVITLHGVDIHTAKSHWAKCWSRRLRQYPEKLVQLSLHKRVRFVAVSEAIVEAAIQFGLPKSKLNLVYTGVDTETFKPSSIPMERRPKRVLFVGRLVEKKGPEYFLQAFEKVQKMVPDAEAVLVGDGPMKKKLEQYVKNARLSGVRFTGAISSSQVCEEMSQARILCLPSVKAKNGDAEGFGMVLLEAQACGLPVVTSAIGGSTEGCLHGITGFRVEEKDISGIVKHIAELLSDPHLLSRMSVSARSFVEGKFDIRNCQKRLEDIYDEMIRK